MSKLSEYERELLSIVDAHGWQCSYVFDPEGKTPDFGYSVGFSKTLNSPEIIIFGLPREVTNAMLWEVFRQLKDGAVPQDGMRWQHLLEGFDCISKKAAHADLFSDYATSAKWFWREQGHAGAPEVYQIVWPGAQQGLFPWEEGCAQAVIDAQPKLWQDA